jgi:hypothetical protein
MYKGSWKSSGEKFRDTYPKVHFSHESFGGVTGSVESGMGEDTE